MSGPGRWTAWTGTSPRRPRTGAGSPTSPASRPGPGSSMSRSCRTCSDSGSWAGGRRPRCAAISPSMRSSMRSGNAAARSRTSPASSITPTAGSVPLDRLHRAPHRRRGAGLGRVARGLLRQRRRGVRLRALQDRTHQKTRSLAGPGRRRDRDPGMGRLVQPPPAAQLLGRHSTCRVRTQLPPSDHRPGNPPAGRTEPPQTPERFMQASELDPGAVDRILLPCRRWDRISTGPFGWRTSRRSCRRGHPVFGHPAIAPCLR